MLSVNSLFTRILSAVEQVANFSFLLQKYAINVTKENYNSQIVHPLRYI